MNEGPSRLAQQVINLDEQFEMNRVDAAYYLCPYSTVYKSVLFYRMLKGDTVRASAVRMPRPSLQLENKQH
ncbi:hypothetical protein ACTXT7_009203 [Hymenolepis weldensis]